MGFRWKGGCFFGGGFGVIDSDDIHGFSEEIDE